LHHVKYVLASSGDTGTIRTLDNPLVSLLSSIDVRCFAYDRFSLTISIVPQYAQRVVKDQLFCLDREARARVLSIDTTEARFKLALANKRVSKVFAALE
jgi:coatomer protein complex subunit alpha (xenin)